jgi:hypothetical protein
MMRWGMPPPPWPEVFDEHSQYGVTALARR